MIEHGKESFYSKEVEQFAIPDASEIRSNLTLFLPFILSFSLLMEHFFILHKQQELDYLWVGFIAVFFSFSTIATYCKPRFRQVFLANVPMVSVCIGLLMFWNLLSIRFGVLPLF